MPASHAAGSPSDNLPPAVLFKALQTSFRKRNHIKSFIVLSESKFRVSTLSHWCEVCCCPNKLKFIIASFAMKIEPPGCLSHLEPSSAIERSLSYCFTWFKVTDLLWFSFFQIGELFFLPRIDFKKKKKRKKRLSKYFLHYIRGFFKT
uniref:Uncharacterized protein n=1 Tax=Micrurus carvalhoi TaxID=3147026 RepID=A0A2H6MWH5_9SAUR